MTEASRTYIIWAPPYQKSNGIRALYRLYKELVKRGFTAYIYCAKPPLVEGYQYISDISEKLRREAIVIYPESIAGNPLKMYNVVRWVLYYPDKSTGDKKYAANEIIFSWMPEYYAAPHLQVQHLNHELFFVNPKIKKDTISYFVYKGGQCRDLPELKDAVKITYDWPPTREELAHLLQRTKTLYSFDAYSALNDEALLCGAEVKIVKPTEIIEHNRLEEISDAEFAADLDNFIRITQNYYVTEEPIYPAKRWVYVKETANHKIYCICGLKIKFKKKNLT